MTTNTPPTAPVPPQAACTDIEDLRAWLSLAHAGGLRPIALRALLKEFGGPQEVLAQPFDALAAVAGEAAAHAVLAPPSHTELGAFDDYVQRAAEWSATPGNRLLTLADPVYPPSLLTMPDPPPLLYLKGRVELMQARAIAIVGSRSATPQGIEDARRFARALSDAGLAVVSGLALGIDAAAHRGALDGAGGTIAVIGTGADLVYPAQNHALAHLIAADGAIVSEWPLGTPARAANFPQRNRLIAGFASGVLIVEAAMRSGSLITARLANEMGRDVYAIPGSIHSPLSRGCHRMIKQGAKLVETPEDVLEEFGIDAAPDADSTAGRRAKTTRGAHLAAPPAATASWASASLASRPAELDRVLTALGHAPATLEILATRTELEGAALQALLLQLELAGRVETLPGGRYVRIERL
jgi:DNA processing protein